MTQATHPERLRAFIGALAELIDGNPREGDLLHRGGKVFTVSGVIVAFRRTALHRVGYWSPDMITEDIDISWGRTQVFHQAHIR